MPLTQGSEDRLRRLAPNDQFERPLMDRWPRDSTLAARGEKHFLGADVHDGDSAIAWRLER